MVFWRYESKSMIKSQNNAKKEIPTPHPDRISVEGQQSYTSYTKAFLWRKADGFASADGSASA